MQRFGEENFKQNNTVISGHQWQIANVVIGQQAQFNNRV